MHELHFDQAKEKSKCGFGALIAINAIDVQGIAATAGAGGVKLQTEIVPAEKPIEGVLGVFVPTDIGGGAVSFQTGGDGGVRFDGLLIEVGSGLAATIEPVATDGPEVSMLGGLHLHKPF